MRLIPTICVLLFFTTCRKKSDVTITAWNYALAEPIANAEVIIVESKFEGGLFNANSTCKEIAKAITDANGKCIFNDIKLKKTKGVQYAAKLKYSYGKSDRYNCNVTENSEVKLGNSTVVLNSSTYDCFFKIQTNNLLTPSLPGDSLIARIKSPKYEVPGQPYPFGGGGVFFTGPYYGANGFPYPSTLFSEVKPTNAGKNVLYIRKRKLGIITQTVDTIKIYPYETKLIEINW